MSWRRMWIVLAAGVAATGACELTPRLIAPNDDAESSSQQQRVASASHGNRPTHGAKASAETPVAEQDVSAEVPAAADVTAMETRTDQPAEHPRESREAEPTSDEPTAAQRRTLYFSTTFAAGQCRFSDCAKDGWSMRADGGTHESRCNFGNCLENGWTTSHPGSQTSRTSCRFRKCMTHGWQTSHPDGRSSTTSCRFNDCFEDGWQTSYPDGSSSTTSCNFGKCATDGWTTRFSDGRSIRCTCRFGDCLENGSSCG